MIRSSLDPQQYKFSIWPTSLGNSFYVYILSDCPYNAKRQAALQYPTAANIILIEVR